MRNIKKEFYESNAWGLLTSVDLYGCNPEKIRDARAIKKYVDELCELIEMKQFGETQIVNFGEDEKVAGFSMVQLIETSLISGHFANKSNNAYIDIFSCKYYEPSVALEFTKKFFEAKEVKMHYVLRR
jgi:S-adenosylmethionine/arginine decarboxylase-like enzyme